MPAVISICRYTHYHWASGSAKSVMVEHAARTLQTDGHLHGVIVACQRDDGRWLLIRRSATVASPLKVCFPGGGIDGDESQQQCARREMLEELGAQITPLHCVWQQSWPDKKLTLFGWHAELDSNELQPDPAEVAEVLWLTEAELLAHPEALPGCADFMAALLARGRRGSSSY